MFIKTFCNATKNPVYFNLKNVARIVIKEDIFSKKYVEVAHGFSFFNEIYEKYDKKAYNDIIAYCESESNKMKN